MKFLILVSTVLLCTTLFSCNSLPDQNDTDTQTESYVETLPPDTTPRPINPSGLETEGLSVELPSTTVEYEGAYDKLIPTLDLPDNFVYYDDLKIVGNFKHFSYLSSKQYMYALRDASGNEVYVSIYADRPRDITKYPLCTDVNLNDMRTVSTEGTCYYTNGGIDYSFVAGQLNYISWYEDGLKFVISYSRQFKDYPIKKDSFVAKLLSLETAHDAVALVSPNFDK